MAISNAGFHISVENSEKLRISGAGKQRERVEKILKKVARSLDVSPEVSVEVVERIPSHVGLGSTTQLTLALARAVSILHGKDIGIPELASRSGRGKRSGVGTYAFEHGGIVLEGGKRDEEFPPLILRRPFPEEWRLVIAIPDVKRGFSEREEGVMDGLRSEENSSDKICRLVLLKMLPALVLSDIEDFGRAITEADELTGKAFSSEQGGTFKDDTISETRNYMLEEGAYGAGQSSWGPTVYGLVQGEKGAKHLEGEISDFLERMGKLGKTFVATPNNTGANVEIIN